MTPAQLVAVAIEATRLARTLVSQIQLSQMEELPPETREQLLAERDRLDKEWAALAPLARKG